MLGLNHLIKEKKKRKKGLQEEGVHAGERKRENEKEKKKDAGACSKS